MNEHSMGGIQAIEQSHGACLPTCKIETPNKVISQR